MDYITLKFRCTIFYFMHFTDFPPQWANPPPAKGRVLAPPPPSPFARVLSAGEPRAANIYINKYIYILYIHLLSLLIFHIQIEIFPFYIKFYVTGYKQENIDKNQHKFHVQIDGIF